MTLAVGRQFGSATHCVRSIFVCRNKLIGIRGYTYAAYYKQQGRSSHESPDSGTARLIDAEAYEQADGIGKYDYG